MANYKNLIPFIKQAEGGLSKATTDTASAHPVPDGSGYHTNKGITWQTWSGVFGSSPDSIQRFYAMSNEDWGTIYKKYYWDSVMADNIQSQRVADTLVNWVWSSGQYTPVSKLQKIVGVPADGAFGNHTLQAVNSADESSLYDQLKTTAYNWFSALGDESKFAANKTGWLNRLTNLANYVESSVESGVASVENTAKQNPVKLVIAIALLGIGLAVVIQVIRIVH